MTADDIGTQLERNIESFEYDTGHIANKAFEYAGKFAGKSVEAYENNDGDPSGADFSDIGNFSDAWEQGIKDVFRMEGDNGIKYIDFAQAGKQVDNIMEEEEINSAQELAQIFEQPLNQARQSLQTGLSYGLDEFEGDERESYLNSQLDNPGNFDTDVIAQSPQGLGALVAAEQASFNNRNVDDAVRNALGNQGMRDLYE